MMLRSPCGAVHEDTNISTCCKASYCRSTYVQRLLFTSNALHSRLRCSSSRQCSASTQRRQIDLHSDRGFVSGTSEGPPLAVQTPSTCCIKPSNGQPGHRVELSPVLLVVTTAQSAWQGVMHRCAAASTRRNAGCCHASGFGSAAEPSLDEAPSPSAGGAYVTVPSEVRFGAVGVCTCDT